MIFFFFYTQIASNKSFQHKTNIFSFSTISTRMQIYIYVYAYIKYGYVGGWCHIIWVYTDNVLDEGDMSKNKTILYHFTILHPIAVFI